MKDSVIVSTGYGRLHLYHAAFAAQEANLLRSMITSLYLKKKWRPLVKIVAKLAGKNAFKRMLLRYDKSLKDTKVVSLPSSEFVSRVRAFITHRGVKKEFRLRLERMESIYYGKRANRYIKDGVKLIHSRSGYSRIIIPHAKIIGAKVLLEQSAAHPEFVAKIMDEEYEKWDIRKKYRKYISPAKEMEWDIKHSDYILTNSEFCADTIRPYVKNPENVRVVYTGVDINYFRPTKQDKRKGFTILFLGALTTNKGVIYLLNAFKKLRLHDARLLVVGDKSIDAIDICEKFREYHEYHSSIPHNEVPTLLARANVFVLPSLVEGSARVVGEAMASGLPCIVTSNCGSIIRDGHDGFVVPIQDEDAIAEKILYLYKNRCVCHEMGQEARKSAVSFLSWENYQQNLIKVYKEILTDKDNN